MARVFSRKEMDKMISEAVAKATAPLPERIVALAPAVRLPAEFFPPLFFRYRRSFAVDF